MGYWLGSVDGPRGHAFGGRALITGSGEMHFIVSSTSSIASTPELLVYGNVCCEARIDVDLKSKEYLRERESNARFRARIEGDTLTGDFKIRGDDYKFSLDRSPRYAETLTLQDLAGTFTRTTLTLLSGSSTYTITIDPNGQLHGSHTNGCVYAGTVSIADPPNNLAKLSVQLSNCPSSITGSGSMNGQYSGLGFLARNTTASNGSAQGTDVFLHSLIGPTWLGQQSPER